MYSSTGYCVLGRACLRHSLLFVCSGRVNVNENTSDENAAGKQTSKGEQSPVYSSFLPLTQASTSKQALASKH